MQRENIEKTYSETFKRIRNKIQDQMKKKNITYDDILKLIKEDTGR